MPRDGGHRPGRDQTDKGSGMSDVTIIWLTGGIYFALVDTADAPLVSGYAWRPISPENSRTSYAAAHSSILGRDVLMHRIILDLTDPDIHVDHVNGNGLDNTRKNLRTATPSQNHANTERQRNNTSGYKGVSYAKDRNKYHAYIKVNGQRESLGYFSDPTEAARAYDTAARKAWGVYARTNFPDDGRITPPRRKIRSNVTGFRNVSWRGASGKWQARITINGQRKSLGYFNDLADAARAYDRAISTQINLHKKDPCSGSAY